jgi:hypothetical protein
MLAQIFNIRYAALSKRLFYHKIIPPTYLVKSLTTGIATNLLFNLPILAVGEALKTFPLIGSGAGGVIMADSFCAAIIAAGIVYMKALAALIKRYSELTRVNLQAVVDSLVSNKESMKQMVKDANQEYEAAKTAGELGKNSPTVGRLKPVREPMRLRLSTPLEPQFEQNLPNI